MGPWGKKNKQTRDILTISFVLEIGIYTQKRSFHFSLHHHNTYILQSLISLSSQRNTVEERINMIHDFINKCTGIKDTILSPHVVVETQVLETMHSSDTRFVLKQ